MNDQVIIEVNGVKSPVDLGCPIQGQLKRLLGNSDEYQIVDAGVWAKFMPTERWINIYYIHELYTWVQAHSPIAAYRFIQRALMVPASGREKFGWDTIEIIGHNWWGASDRFEDLQGIMSRWLSNVGNRSVRDILVKVVNWETLARLADEAGSIYLMDTDREQSERDGVPLDIIKMEEGFKARASYNGRWNIGWAYTTEGNGVIRI